MPNEDRSSCRRSCPECGGEMEPGFILDADRTGVSQQHWKGGMPEYHDTVFGIPVGAYELKVDRSNLVPVVTWRCSACHLLRSYAE